ncbi:MAG: cytochrome d ubiquinol oxidase subunit II [Nitrococcus mobilis]|nr:cytochrome d ubiquinol oxidase subunit II [Nitrococcus mobilis]
MAGGVHAFLAEIWFGLLSLILMLYVVLDGFDLGVGMITLGSRNEHELGIMMATLGSIWDGNETWLVLFGGALFGAFPLVYGTVLHGLYVPIMAMIFGLMFRAVAFEFRENARRKRLWDLAFGFGSLLAALAQGLALGAIISGMAIENGRFTGGILSWFGPFTLLVAIGVVSGYSLLGASYLIVKTVGPLQAMSRRIALWTGWLTVAVGMGVSLWTPLRFPYIRAKWLGPDLFWLMILPIVAGIAFLMFLRSLRRYDEVAPFVWSIVIFAASLIGLAASLFPYMVPPNVTLYEAAAPSYTLVFMLTGIGLLLPIMLVYNGYQYLVFRGKITEAGYG